MSKRKGLVESTSDPSKRALRDRTKRSTASNNIYVEVHKDGEAAYFGWFHPEKDLVDGMVTVFCVDETQRTFREAVAPNHLRFSKYGRMEGRDSSVLDCDIAMALRNWTRIPYSDDASKTYKAALMRSDANKATVILKNTEGEFEIHTFETAREVNRQSYVGKWKAKYGQCTVKIEMNERLADLMQGKEGTMLVLDDFNLGTTRAVAAKNKQLRFIVPNPEFERKTPRKIRGVDVVCVRSDLDEFFDTELSEEVLGAHVYLDFTWERDKALPFFQRVVSALVSGQVIAGTFCVRHLTTKEVDDLPRWLLNELAVPHMDLNMLHHRAYRNGGRMFTFILVAESK